MHSNMVSSLPGLYLLDASACLLPCGDQQKYHQTLPNGWGEVGRTNFPSSQFTTPVLDSRKKDAWELEGALPGPTGPLRGGSMCNSVSSVHGAGPWEPGYFIRGCDC